MLWSFCSVKFSHAYLSQNANLKIYFVILCKFQTSNIVIYLYLNMFSNFHNITGDIIERKIIHLSYGYTHFGHKFLMGL